MLPQLDVILARECRIEGPDGEVSPLIVSLSRPRPSEIGRMEGIVRLECKHFEKDTKAYGVDEIDVLVHLLGIGRILLEDRERDGYSIWWLERGDLQYFDFWAGSQFPQVFCLPSAYNRAQFEAFASGNEGRRLMPSCRVGIESERPAVTIYRVQEDGRDTLGSVIGPEELKGRTWESVAELVGRRILWDSREGVDLLMSLQPERRIDES